MEKVISHQEKLDNWPLAEGIRPIRICIGRYRDFEKNFFERFKSPNACFLDWNNRYQNTYSPYSSQKDSGIMITSIDSSDKFSPEYINCTGLLLVGKNTGGKTISCLTHQNPKYIKDLDIENNFRDTILKLFKDFKNQTQSGTVEILSFGGNMWTNEERNALDIEINKTCLEIFGFIPKNVFGPKRDNFRGPDFDIYSDTDNEDINGFGDSVFFDTENKRLFFMRDETLLDK